MKIVVFDLDETLGYFTQFSIFWSILENYLNPNYILNENDFNKIFSLYPEYLRPNIFNILNFLKLKKITKSCSKILIYTNNNGSKLWSKFIINFFETKLKYSPFIDQIIAAFKINGKQIEIGRTTHKKTHNDLIRCTKLPNNVEICYIDDNYYPEMINDNVFYINIKPYIYEIDFNILLNRFKSSNIYKILIKNEDEFLIYFNNLLDKYNYKVLIKDPNEYEIDKILGKEILIHLQDFFLDCENTNSTNKFFNKTKKNKYYKNKTIKKT